MNQQTNKRNKLDLGSPESIPPPPDPANEHAIFPSIDNVRERPCQNDLTCSEDICLQSMCVKYWSDLGFVPNVWKFRGGGGVEMRRVLDDAIGIVDYCNEGSWKTEYVSFYIRNSHR